MLSVFMLFKCTAKALQVEPTVENFWFAVDTCVLVPSKQDESFERDFEALVTEVEREKELALNSVVKK
jgi:hypothetical protein